MVGGTKTPGWSVKPIGYSLLHLQTYLKSATPLHTRSTLGTLNTPQNQ